MDNADNKVQLTTFKVGLKSKEFGVVLAKSPLESMIELLLKAQKYMNAEDALTAIKVKEPQKGRIGAQDDPKGKKRERKDHSSSDDRIKQRDNKARRMVNFTPLVTPIDKILMQIQDDHPLKWPKPLNSSPNARSKKKYCHFHQDYGHYTEKCKDLKEQKGKLQNS